MVSLSSIMKFSLKYASVNKATADDTDRGTVN